MPAGPRARTRRAPQPDKIVDFRAFRRKGGDDEGAASGPSRRPACSPRRRLGDTGPSRAPGRAATPWPSSSRPASIAQNVASSFSHAPSSSVAASRRSWVAPRATSKPASSPQPQDEPFSQALRSSGSARVMSCGSSSPTRSIEPSLAQAMASPAAQLLSSRARGLRDVLVDAGAARQREREARARPAVVPVAGLAVERERPRGILRDADAVLEGPAQGGARRPVADVAALLEVRRRLRGILRDAPVPSRYWCRAGGRPARSLWRSPPRAAAAWDPRSPGPAASTCLRSSPESDASILSACARACCSWPPRAISRITVIR